MKGCFYVTSVTIIPVRVYRFCISEKDLRLHQRALKDCFSKIEKRRSLISIKIFPWTVAKQQLHYDYIV